MKTTLKTLAFFTALACIAPVQATVLLSRPPTAGGTYSDYGPPRQFVANRYKLPGANGYADITKITLYGYWAFVPARTSSSSR